MMFLSAPPPLHPLTQSPFPKPMPLLDKLNIQFHRDEDFEAFYEADLVSRRRIVTGHFLILLIPFAFTLLWFSQSDLTLVRWAGWGSGAFFFIIIISETVAYMFPKMREVYKTYGNRIIIPLSAVGGFGFFYAGQKMGSELAESTILGTDMLYYGAGFVFCFISFGLAQYGMAQLTRAAKSIWYDKAALEADMRFATLVQERILADTRLEHGNIKAWAASIPASELGGDYFELSASEDRVMASVGDISGHSFGAGLLMTTLKSALHTHLQYIDEPAEVLRRLNSLMMEQSDRSMFATMTLLSIDHASSTATLASAGHLPVFHIDGSSGELHHRYVKAPGLGMSRRAEFSSISFPVSPGDVLLLYSDGLVETRNKEGAIREPAFFEEQIRALLPVLSSGPDAIGKKLMEHVQNSNYASGFEDDATLVVLQVV